MDLNKQYAKIRGEINQAIREVLESQAFILGPQVELFERKMAAFLGVDHAIGVASGTDALLLSLMALGVKAGDRVLTVAYTFFATSGSISRLGALPVYVDIDPRTYNLDPNRLEDTLKKIRRKAERPKVLMPVHLFGQMADMPAIMEIARRYEMGVVEDAAQALGASQEINSQSEGRGWPGEWMAGTVGNLGCFSFYPTKNLGGIGDGGMVVTRDGKLAERVRLLRVHGEKLRYHHQLIGINSRLDALQAAVLRVKLKYLDRWTESRRRNAERYRFLFPEAGLRAPAVSLPAAQRGQYHTFHQFVIRAKGRDALREQLTRKGIGSAIYYPVPLHLQACYRSLGYHPGDLPESERAAQETLALPIYPELTSGQQRKIVRAIADFYAPQRSQRTPRRKRIKNQM